MTTITTTAILSVNPVIIAVKHVLEPVESTVPPAMT